MQYDPNQFLDGVKQYFTNISNKYDAMMNWWINLPEPYKILIYVVFTIITLIIVYHAWKDRHYWRLVYDS